MKLSSPRNCGLRYLVCFSLVPLSAFQWMTRHLPAELSSLAHILHAVGKLLVEQLQADHKMQHACRKADHKSYVHTSTSSEISLEICWDRLSVSSPSRQSYLADLAITMPQSA